MDDEEWAINIFCLSQTEAVLAREGITDKAAANWIHHQVGLATRRAIAELGGTMPEDLLAIDSLKKLERQQTKKALPVPKKRRASKSDQSVDQAEEAE